jgi:hypothetical protein
MSAIVDNYITVSQSLVDVAATSVGQRDRAKHIITVYKYINTHFPAVLDIVMTYPCVITFGKKNSILRLTATYLYKSHTILKEIMTPQNKICASDQFQLIEELSRANVMIERLIHKYRAEFKRVAAIQTYPHPNSDSIWPEVRNYLLENCVELLNY